MAKKNMVLSASGSSNYDSLKGKLGSMRGILSMDIDSRSKQVSVDFDDVFVNEKQITRMLSEIGYQPSK